MSEGPVRDGGIPASGSPDGSDPDGQGSSASFRAGWDRPGVLLAVSVLVTGFLVYYFVASARVEQPVVESIGLNALPSSAPEPTEPPPEPAEEPTSELRTTKQLPNSDSTLLQVRKVRPGPGYEPQSGDEWFGVRARTCMHADARASGRLGWRSWAMTDSNGRRHRGQAPPDGSFPAQQYTSTILGPGECLVGWVLISVPEGTFRRAQSVVFLPPEPDATWVL